MSFGGGSNGSSSVAASTDVLLSNPANNQVLTYDGTSAKWTNKAQSGGSPTYDNLPAGTTLTVMKSGTTWPSRPTARTDIVVQWKGPDPSPSIVSSGTGGMLDNVDVRFVTP